MVATYNCHIIPTRRARASRDQYCAYIVCWLGVLPRRTEIGIKTAAIFRNEHALRSRIASTKSYQHCDSEEAKMTVLGRSELIDRMRADTLVISPILSRRQIGAASVDLRMGNVVLMVRARGSSHVDPAAFHETRRHSQSVELHRQQKHERYEIP